MLRYEAVERRLTSARVTVGEVGLLFSTRRNVTARCCGSCQVIVLDRASYQTAIATLPREDRVGELEKVLHKFWLLVSRAGPGHTATESVGFAVYRQLHIRESGVSVTYT
jgi:hypothetical protein